MLQCSNTCIICFQHDTQTTQLTGLHVKDVMSLRRLEVRKDEESLGLKLLLQGLGRKTKISRVEVLHDLKGRLYSKLLGTWAAPSKAKDHGTGVFVPTILLISTFLELIEARFLFFGKTGNLFFGGALVGRSEPHWSISQSCFCHLKNQLVIFSETADGDDGLVGGGGHRGGRCGGTRPS